MEKVNPELIPTHKDLDFTQWADGATWRAKQGADFHGTPEGFRTALRRWAKKNEHALTMKRDANAVIFRLTPPS